MKIFEWISQAYLRPHPRPPYVIQFHDNTAGAGTPLSVAATIPADVDFLGLCSVRASAGAAQTISRIEFNLTAPGVGVDFTAAYLSPPSGSLTEWSALIPEIYIPRGFVVEAVGVFNAGVASNRIDLTLFGYGVPPADVI